MDDHSADDLDHGFEVIHHGGDADHPQEILRRRLYEMSRYVSLPKMLDLCARAKVPPPIGKKALGNFINNETKALDAEHFAALQKVFLHSYTARLLRFPTTEDLPQFDALMLLLAGGQRLKPRAMEATGRYYLYHGSYLRKDHCIIRALDVRLDGDQILAVTDYIKEPFSPAASGTIHEAHGVMTFAYGKPQILFHAHENKIGLSLMVGTTPSVANGALHRMTGALLVLTAENAALSRRFILVRENKDSLAAMKKQTGGFHLSEILHWPAGDKHRQAFELLAQEKYFEDPVASLRFIFQPADDAKKQGK